MKLSNAQVEAVAKDLAKKEIEKEKAEMEKLRKDKSNIKLAKKVCALIKTQNKIQTEIDELVGFKFTGTSESTNVNNILDRMCSEIYPDQYWRENKYKEQIHLASIDAKDLTELYDRLEV